MNPELKKFWKLYSAITALFVLLVVGGLYTLNQEETPEPVAPTPVVVEPEPVITSIVIGASVEARPISVTSIGTGTTNLLVVGGMHGGYEWNSSLLAYQMIEHFSTNPSLVPDGVTLSIIPDLNPDGTYAVTGMVGEFEIADVPDPSTRVAEARFNANDVDLNRNFDCKWAPESTWRGNPVSAGTAAFSEPEAAALRDWVATSQPKAAIFLHSQANNVYASECENGILPDTLTLMSTYATAANYGEVPVFDAYPITGDAEGWLASIGIPAVTVELQGFESTEWERNLAGITATLGLYK